MTPTEKVLKNARHITQAERHVYAIGDECWRADYARIERGEVVRQMPCDFDSQGNIIRRGDEGGAYTLTVAKFPSGYQEQTYGWKFFPTRELAIYELQMIIERRINDTKRDLQKLEDLRDAALAMDVQVRE
ncbi:hypothetical protein HOU03_gp261 [Caulobacter phage CcrSC]|uniref:Uncharacterized protein n=1 Tax=Caulobacter phage CcrSC TaxID=2283272 RepID=A0A385EGH2_9CAUD|nr:hypothetical protein HOU03_gp261 [Caulobacter phage CcrSC]AXQ70007.1 hypothetical protein CcrSC_gp425 [Caulobacter phage CcrSC]